jgi:ribosome biogenesis GTPase
VLISAAATADTVVAAFLVTRCLIRTETIMSSTLQPDSSALALGQGVVFKKSQGTYWVRAADTERRCSISSRLRKDLIYPTAAPTSLHHRVQAVHDIHAVDPVAVGDIVDYTPADHETGVITGVRPRRNALVRPAAGDKPLEQVIVANVDQVVPVFATANPLPKWELLDRYLAAAEAAGVPSLIVITKMDLAGDEAARDLEAEMDNYSHIGYGVALTSANTGRGVEAFLGALRGRLSVFIGKSGVGKTSLLNAVEPGLGLRVKATSQATGKGRHATTHLELHGLSAGGAVVDTPGMREFGLWKMAGPDLANGFVEMRPYLGQCKFGLGCSHSHEPGCAVKEAVAQGLIAPRRYASYLRMQGD